MWLEIEAESSKAVLQREVIIGARVEVIMSTQRLANFVGRN